MSCEAVSIWQWIAGGCAVLSAFLWIAASLFKVPPPPISYETLDGIAAALKKQGRYNALAALAAALAAAIQAFLLFAPTCIHLS
jgi:hypothetical protein